MRNVAMTARDAEEHGEPPPWGQGLRPRYDAPRTPPGPRFTPPDVPAFAVARQRLVSLVDPAIQRRVTTVVAPPGYGKTVLLSQWAAARPQRRVCWLTLQSHDNDAAHFAHDLHQALGCSAEAVQTAVAGVDSGDPETLRVCIAAIESELGNAPPTTLLFDDFHLLTDVVILDELGALLDRLPPWIQVVLATRVDPPLRHHRLRLSDALVEVRQEDLAFQREEAASLVRHVAGRKLTRHQLHALMVRTGGWAVGLQLAAVAMRNRSDVDQFVETFAADDRHVADYLTEHVLSRQPDAIRRFLLSTSVLRGMNGSLCDFVTGRSGGQAMLDELERMSLFTGRLDGRSGWLRYHQLFRALLRHHLREDDPVAEVQLLHRAAEWHLARDEVPAAVDYLVEAGAWEEVLEAASAYSGSLLSKGRAAMVARWIERVPRSVWQARPRVLLLHAAASIAGGDPRAATAELDAVGALPSASAADRAVADALRARGALQQGATRQALAAADRVLRAVDRLDDADLPHVLGTLRRPEDLRAAARHARGVALWYLGDAGARTTLEAVLHDGGDAVWEIAALSSLALLDAWSGRLTSGSAFAARALALARQVDLAQQVVTADAYLAIAHIARERDELGPAATFLERAARWASPGRRPVAASLVRIERAHLAFATGGPADGVAILAGHRARARPHPLQAPSVLARRRAAEARLLTMTGDLDGADRVLDLAPDDTDDIMAARVMLAVERGDGYLGRAMLARWPMDPEPRACRERLLWLSVLDHLEGDDVSAARHLATVVADAEAEGTIGPFRAAGHHALGPARVLYRSSPTAFLRTVVDRLAETPTRRARPAEELVEQLTERESMVLMLLPSRLSNSEIAQRLGVSPNTLKTHLKHIYRKFSVAGRSGAVSAAERMRLL